MRKVLYSLDFLRQWLDALAGDVVAKKIQLCDAELALGNIDEESVLQSLKH